MLGKSQELTPNTLELKDGPEEQRRSRSTITADTAAKLTSTVVFRWLRWTKGSINRAQSTTATWRSRNYAEQELRCTMDCWPRRRAHDGGAAGREEERRVLQFPSGVKLQELVSWVCKEQAEL